MCSYVCKFLKFLLLSYAFIYFSYIVFFFHRFVSTLGTIKLTITWNFIFNGVKNFSKNIIGKPDISWPENFYKIEWIGISCGIIHQHFCHFDCDYPVQLSFQFCLYGMCCMSWSAILAKSCNVIMAPIVSLLAVVKCFINNSCLHISLCILL